MESKEGNPLGESQVEVAIRDSRMHFQIKKKEEGKRRRQNEMKKNDRKESDTNRHE